MDTFKKLCISENISGLGSTEASDIVCLTSFQAQSSLGASICSALWGRARCHNLPYLISHAWFRQGFYFLQLDTTSVPLAEFGGLGSTLLSDGLLAQGRGKDHQPTRRHPGALISQFVPTCEVS